MYACNGILFNHESPRRGDFRHAQDHARGGEHQGGQAGVPVPRQHGREARLGHARDYVECMKMLQQDGPDDFVVATGETNTVRHFVSEAFKVAGMELKFEGEGVNEVGIEVATGRTLARARALLPPRGWTCSSDARQGASQAQVEPQDHHPGAAHQGDGRGDYARREPLPAHLST